MCPAETTRDILRIILGEQEEPLLELLGLEVFLELCVVIRTEEESTIDIANLTPAQLTLIRNLLNQIKEILGSALSVPL